ncbi:hypothetical protein pb186bvf_007301 [Paramecium bursaria]
MYCDKPHHLTTIPAACSVTSLSHYGILQQDRPPHC